VKKDQKTLKKLYLFLIEEKKLPEEFLTTKEQKTTNIIQQNFKLKDEFENFD